MAAPEAVTLVRPADGAAGVPVDLVLQWDTLASASTYRLQVAVDTAFSSLVVDDTALVANSDTIGTALANDTEHFWRVRASNDGGDGAWSEVWSFTTIIASPDVVTLVSPDNGATEVAAYTMFSWHGLNGAAAFHLRSVVTQSSRRPWWTTPR